MTEPKPKTMSEIHAELLNAQADHSECVKVANLARRNEIDALHRLMSAQRAFDKMIGEIKATGAVGDWAKPIKGETV